MVNVLIASAILIFVSIAAVIFASPPSSSFSYSSLLAGVGIGPIGNLIFNRTEMFFDSACHHYNLEFSGDLNEWSRKSASLKTNRVDVVVGKFKSDEWDIYVNQKYTETLPNRTEVCKPFELDNGSFKNCTWVYHGDYQEERTKMVWIDYNLSNLLTYKSQLHDKLSKGDNIYVRNCLRFDREWTENGYEISLDHVPEYLGKVHNEFMWTNSSLNLSRNITLSGAKSSYGGYQPIIEFNATNTNFSEFMTNGEDLWVVHDDVIIPHAIKEWNRTLVLPDASIGRAVVAVNTTAVCDDMTECNITIHYNASEMTSNSSFARVYPTAYTIWDADDSSDRVENRRNPGTNFLSYKGSGNTTNSTGVYGSAFQFGGSGGISNGTSSIRSFDASGLGSQWTILNWVYFETATTNPMILRPRGLETDFLTYMQEGYLYATIMSGVVALASGELLLSDVPVYNYTWNQYGYRNGSCQANASASFFWNDVIRANKTQSHPMNLLVEWYFHDQWTSGYITGQMDEMMIFTECKDDDYFYYAYNNPEATFGGRVTAAPVTTCSTCTVNCADACSWASEKTCTGDLKLYGTGSATLSAELKMTGASAKLNISPNCYLNITSTGFVNYSGGA
jgi:hypothetical protein